MGAVYEAEHTRINRRVAIKMMHPDTTSEPDAVKRFLREAESASAIGHPNIIEIYDVGVEGDGTAYIVMELLDGVSLDVVLERKRALPPTRAVAIVLQILSALHSAHAKGIIHRDLKPENVFMAVDSRNREEVKLLDFGVAKVQEATEDSLRLTKTGTVLGTPSYLSPEQARGRKDIDERIDIWAAGVMLYRMLAGELPFKGESYNEVLANVLIEEPAPLGPLAPAAPEGLVEVVGKAMTKDRDGRFLAVSAMIEALLPFCERAEYEMTTQVFKVLRKSMLPRPALPKVDTGTGMPAIPPASAVPGLPDTGPGGAGRRDESGEREIADRDAAEGAERDEETTLDEPIEPQVKSGSLAGSPKRTTDRAANTAPADLVGDGEKREAWLTGRLKLLTPKQVALSALLGSGLAVMAIWVALIGGERADEGLIATLAPEQKAVEPVASGEPAAEPTSARTGPTSEVAAPAALAEPRPGADPEPGEQQASGKPLEAESVSRSEAKPQAFPTDKGPSRAEPLPGVGAPATVVIQLRRVPPAAAVTLNGERVKPPLEIERSETAKQLRVTAPGRRPFIRSVKLDRDQLITVHMPKLVAAKRPAARRKSPTKPQKKPEKMLLSNPFK